jgi:hypothetical protein
LGGRGPVGRTDTGAFFGFHPIAFASDLYCLVAAASAAQAAGGIPAGLFNILFIFMQSLLLNSMD